ncbi:MAG: lysine--tRNA ligase, partial [Clostridiales bacterium]|nr:lysine--tRNA ligase [Candidatus Coliplasma equi]
MEQNKNNLPEQDLNSILKVRREKLSELQSSGNDPFKITKYDVTHHSSDIKNDFENLETKTVSIAGRIMS